jgi:hypothetical protein
VTTSLVSEPARRTRRIVIRDSRLPNSDMRTRIGKRFLTILAGIKAEFGADVDPVRAAEIARLKMITENAQFNCLEGKVNVDRVVRLSNLVTRKERELASLRRGNKPTSGSSELTAYLATLNAADDEAAVP